MNILFAKSHAGHLSMQSLDHNPSSLAGQGGAVIARAEQQLAICACLAESANAADCRLFSQG